MKKELPFEVNSIALYLTLLLYFILLLGRLDYINSDYL